MKVVSWAASRVAWSVDHWVVQSVDYLAGSMEDSRADDLAVPKGSPKVAQMAVLMVVPWAALRDRCSVARSVVLLVVLWAANSVD